MRIKVQKIKVSKYLVLVLAFWAFLLAASLGWNLYQNSKEINERARIEARTIFQHTMAYRTWNSMHGGLYARVSEANRPNPYLKLDNRDLLTEEGVELTLINPFQMTNQVYSMLKDQRGHVGSINRTVSADPLNPTNMADDWEKKALLIFEDGSTEYSEIVKMGDSTM